MSGLLRFKQAVKDVVSRLPGGEWLVKQRFAKFGTVGFAGTVVNIGVLHFSNKFVYQAIGSASVRENLALLTGIFIATLHNFFWNRAWTWGDRKVHGPNVHLRPVSPVLHVLLARHRAADPVHEHFEAVHVPGARQFCRHRNLGGSELPDKYIWTFKARK